MKSNHKTTETMRVSWKRQQSTEKIIYDLSAYSKYLLWNFTSYRCCFLQKPPAAENQQTRPLPARWSGDRELLPKVVTEPSLLQDCSAPTMGAP